MSQERLFTVGVVVYNNAEYLQSALDSILNQTYSDIEIIVSDDGSKNFDCGIWERYIEEHKSDNLKNFSVFEHEKNVGTVRNCNSIVQKASGEYYMFLAADDAFYDENVLERFVKEFEVRGRNCKILSALVAECTGDIQEVIAYSPSVEACEFIRDSSPRKIFNRLALTYTIPAAGSCYRMELYNELGGYDEEYSLMEDGPFFARAARKGYQFGWVNNLIATRHRDGGVSHGNKRNTSKAYQKYIEDEILFTEKEIIPYRERISSANYKAALNRHEYFCVQYYTLFIKPEYSFMERVNFLKQHGWLKAILKQKVKRILRNLYKSVQLFYHATLGVGMAFVGLYFVYKDIYKKKSVLLAKIGVILLEIWVVLKGFSSIRFILKIWKRGDK